MTSKQKKTFNWKEVEKIHFLASKFKENDMTRFFFKIAHQVGVGTLERYVGLVREDPNIKDIHAYLTQMCKNEKK